MVLAATQLPAALTTLLSEVSDLTLTDALLAFGLTHVPGGRGTRAILSGDREVFRGNCFETWAWLRGEQDPKWAALNDAYFAEAQS